MTSDSDIADFNKSVESFSSKLSLSQEGKRMTFRRSEILNHNSWSSKSQYLLATIGFVVGLGNALNFPFIMYKNGGGAFLIPYAIMLFLVGFPLFYMEVALGQFCSRSAFEAFSCVPLLKGVGLTLVFTCMLLSTYYNMIITYCLRYFFASFIHPLPWLTCNHTTSVPECREDKLYLSNLTQFQTCGSNNSNCRRDITAGENYWRHVVLEISPSIGITGKVKVDLLLELLLLWTIISMSGIKGLQYLGKLAYITSSCQYLGFLALLLNALRYDGGLSGIYEFLSPNWSDLLALQTWWNATFLVINSLSVSIGALITLSSFNSFHNNCYWDSWVVIIVDLLSSLFVGITIFAALGHVSKKRSASISDIVENDLILAFIVYPYALSEQNSSPLWASLYFFSLIVLGLDTMFVNIETITITITDGYLISSLLHKKLIAFAVCAAFFVFGINFVTQNGIYWIHLLQEYQTKSIIFIAAIEVFTIGFFYGVERFAEDIELMEGVKPKLFWLVSWRFLTPFITLVVGVISIFIKPVSNLDTSILFIPIWARIIGFLTIASVLISIPLWAINEIVSRKGTIQERILEAAQPNPLWRPLLDINCIGKYEKTLGTPNEEVEQSDSTINETQPESSTTVL